MKEILRMNRMDLLDVLNAAKPALSSLDFIPIQTHFIFNKEGVSAYNDIMGIRVLGNDFGIDCALPGMFLIKLLSSLATPEITIEFLPSENMAKLKSGKSQFTMPFLPSSASIFTLPEEEPELVVRIDGNFLNGLSKCLVSVGDNAEVSQELGVTVRQDKKNFFLYSTNNIAISKYKTHLNDVDGELTKALVVPTQFCQNLIRLTDIVGDEDVVLSLHRDWVFAEISNEVLLFSKIINEEEAHDFESIIGQYISSDKTVPGIAMPQEFFAILERSGLLLSGSSSKYVNISGKGTELTVSAKSNFGASTETCTFPSEITCSEIKMDPALIIKGGKVASKIKFLDDVALMSDGNFIQLISPVSVED